MLGIFINKNVGFLLNLSLYAGFLLNLSFNFFPFYLPSFIVGGKPTRRGKKGGAGNK